MQQPKAVVPISIASWSEIRRLFWILNLKSFVTTCPVIIVPPGLLTSPLKKWSRSRFWKWTCSNFVCPTQSWWSFLRKQIFPKPIIKDQQETEKKTQIIFRFLLFFQAKTAWFICTRGLYQQIKQNLRQQKFVIAKPA